MPESLVVPGDHARAGRGWRRARRVGLRLTVSVIALLVVGNLSIAGAHLLTAVGAHPSVPADIRGVHNLRAVDDTVWRGRAPSDDSYTDLAASGVTTIVDLRAEDDLDVPHERLDHLGLELHALPIRDGQTPTRAQVQQFVDIVEQADGKVFVHCGAGVGRTGSMAAAYLVVTGQAEPRAALRQNLEVGPPSIEQIWYATNLDADGVDQPPAPVTAISRFLDAPRRIWSSVSS